jgi:iron complex transport system ATP-binding protein
MVVPPRQVIGTRPTGPAPTSEPIDGGIAARELTLSYGEKVVVTGADFDLPPASFTAIIGPNGSGKSTILRAISRLLSPLEGAVYIDGASVASLTTKEVARRVGLLPQNATYADRITVSELAALGRHPHQRLLSRWSVGDEEGVRFALVATDMIELADRPIDELSGGQRQRAWIAMTLAQQTSFVLLDEPTTHLDLTAQFDVLDLCRDLTRRGTTVVAVLHDINLAFRYADHVLAMRDGQVVAAGPPEALATADTMANVYEIECRLIADPTLNVPIVVPLRRAGPRPR